MNKNNKISPFNNQVETGLRILIMLNEAYPKSFDIQTLLFLDYIAVHSSDFGDATASLHPPTPKRIGEIHTRRAIIKYGVNLLLTRNLATEIFASKGLEYMATDASAPLVDALNTTYSTILQKKVKWTINNFAEFTAEGLAKLIKRSELKINNEFNFEVLD